MVFLPPGVLILSRKPCSLFCLRLLFCAVVSDIFLLLYVRIGGYYKLKSKYVKQKTAWKQGFDFARLFWYIAMLPLDHEKGH